MVKGQWEKEWKEEWPRARARDRDRMNDKVKVNGQGKRAMDKGEAQE